MLLLLLALSIGYTTVSFIMQMMVKNKNTGTLYSVLSAVQGACMAASLAILAVLIFKGRTL